jgi:hypothetical protein
VAVSQKSQVVVQFLVPVAIAYLLAGVFLLKGALPTTGQMWDHAAAAGIVALAATLVQDLVPKPVKEVLIFWRFRDRLPGHRCFSEKSLSDPRLSRSKIPDVAQLCELSPSEQNRAWYAHYQKVSDRPAVAHYSFRYLAWRDTATLLAILTAISVPLMLSFGGDGAWRRTAIMAAGCACLCILSIVAARLASRELIVAVLTDMGSGESR